MADFPQRQFSGQVSALQGDVRRGLDSIRSDMNVFTARPDDWAEPLPTTVTEAVARIAFHIRSGAGAVKIVVLP